MLTGELWHYAAVVAAFCWSPSAPWWLRRWPSTKTAAVSCRVFSGSQWAWWCSAVPSTVGGLRMHVGGELHLLCFLPCVYPSFGQLFSLLRKVALEDAWLGSFWNHPKGRLMRPSTQPTNTPLSLRGTSLQKGRPCARGLASTPQPGINWWPAAGKTTSVRLWCFCPKGRSTLGFMIQFLRGRTCRTCMATAGALRSMANRSHGAADGGPNGLPTSSWQFHRSAPLRYTTLTAWKAKVKSKTLPLPERNTCAAKPFSGARMLSSSLKVSKMPSRPAWSISRRSKVQTPRHPTQGRCIACSWLGFQRKKPNSWRHLKASGIRRRRKLHGWNETVTSTSKKRLGNLKAHRQ